VAKTASHPNVQVIGLCDVDTVHRDKQLENYNSAVFFQDYREMLAQLGDKIDVVTISTPDHTHYPATLAAMNLGKHVYTQKPLTHAVAEARHLLDVARERDLVTQMGIQNHATPAYRSATQYIQSGVLGKIRKVYAWSSKNWGDDGAPYEGSDPEPASLDWNLWLGTAPSRPYLEKKYHPGQWRRLLDFGCGTLGDMGVHIIDTPFRALELGPAISAQTSCRAPNGFSHPEKNVVQYGFKPTEYTTDDFSFAWYDGDFSPPHSEADLQLGDAEKLPSQGSMFIGEKGRMLLPHCAKPSFFPQTLLQDVGKPDRKRVDHYRQFIDAIDGKDKASADFAYSVPIMETLHLGVIAARFPDKKLEWDTNSMKVANMAEANSLVSKTYRKF
jgi:predicted dehydrogenase